MKRGRAARHWNRASERISWICRPEPLTSVNIFKNFVISKFHAHWTGCYGYVWLSWFATSSRDTFRKWNSNTGGHNDFKLFQNTLLMVTKIMVKVRKPPDWTTTFRRTIAPVDDINLRCNSMSHFKWYVGAPQGVEIAPANEFHECRILKPSPMSIFWKMS